MTPENIIIFEDRDTQRTKDIPIIEGYKTINIDILRAYFKTLCSHSTDLYTVCLFDGVKKITPLFYGTIIDSDSKLTAIEADRKYREEIRHEVYSFALNAKDMVTSNRVYLQTIGKTTIMASRCDKGYIIAAWFNSNADTDISKLMLAYTMLNFAGLNEDVDQTLRKHAFDTIPTDSRFGAFNAHFAKEQFLGQIYALLSSNDNRNRQQGFSRKWLASHCKPRLS